MKKKSRRTRSREAAPAPAPSQDKRSRARTKTHPEQFYQLQNQNQRSRKSGPSREKNTQSSGRLSAAVCRLCHGQFSPRSLRHAFRRRAAETQEEEAESDAGAARSPVLFHADFQRLVGVRLNREPGLSEFICKKCHAKFYKCHSILVRFLQRVNLPPLGPGKNPTCPPASEHPGSPSPSSFTSDSKCLHSLVSWAHRHGEACSSCPGLKEVLTGQYRGSVQAVWGCGDGHSYTMDSLCTNTDPLDQVHSGGGEGGGAMSEEEAEPLEEEEAETLTGIPNPTLQGQNPELNWSRNSSDFLCAAEEPSPVLDGAANTDLSDRVVSEDEFESGHREEEEDELFEPFSDQRTPRAANPNKRRRSPKSPEEPKVKKKPGPKPGWKNQFKAKGEELPNIYKCPYQGCTAVYRAPDGLKKHIKEHHEEVRERPCPHPGCNKVFLIDRYLQRHVKLIHTEERNYICDQCGQTFKQRKHLSVHQMRHSGAKPLQCEVCGFQCRQRASLKYHMTKHKAESDLEFACSVCGKRFEKAHNLNVHMSMVHPVIQTRAQRGGGAPQQQQQQQQQLQHSELRSVGAEVVLQEQDR